MKNFKCSSWTRIRNSASAGIAATLLASVLTACGSADTGTDPYVVSSGGDLTANTSACTTAGTYDIDGTCWEASSFAEACDLAGGDPVNSSDGTATCRKTTTLANIYGTPYASALSLTLYSSIFPRFSVVDGDASGGYSTGLSVQAGDQVSYRIDSGWSEISYSTKSTLWGLLSWTTVTSSCNDVDENGRGVGEDSDDNAQGLYASDGSQLYAMPSSEDSFTVENDGTLSLGFNVEEAGAYGNCGFMNVYKLQVSRCSDEGGETHPCP